MGGGGEVEGGRRRDSFPHSVHGPESIDSLESSGGVQVTFKVSNIPHTLGDKVINSGRKIAYS
jgi:hypothetical protein